MKTSPYINATEGQEVMVVVAVHDGLARLIKTTTEVPKWANKLKLALKHVKAVMDERLECMDAKEQKKAMKRFHTCAIVSGDFNFSNSKQTNYIVPQDDLLDCLNVVCEKYCYGCTRTKWRSCEWKRRFDHMGIFAKNEWPTGYCIYRVDKHEIEKGADKC